MSARLDYVTLLLVDLVQMTPPEAQGCATLAAGTIGNQIDAAIEEARQAGYRQGVEAMRAQAAADAEVARAEDALAQAQAHAETSLRAAFDHYLAMDPPAVQH